MVEEEKKGRRRELSEEKEEERALFERRRQELGEVAAACKLALHGLSCADHPDEQAALAAAALG